MSLTILNGANIYGRYIINNILKNKLYPIIKIGDFRI